MKFFISFFNGLLLTCLLTGPKPLLMSDTGKPSTPPLADTFVSHRGAAALAPENTLSGIDSALSFHAPFIEIDIHRSKDGVLVLMHDKTVDRTTNGKGKIRDLTWEQLKSLDAGSSFSSKFAGEGIPTLKETLRKIVNTKSVLIIEVKSPKLYPGLAKQLLDTIYEEQAGNSTVIASFDQGFLKEIQSIDKTQTTELLRFFVPKLKKVGASKYVSVYWRAAFLQKGRVKKLKDAGYEVWVWTVNKPSRIEKLLTLGIDAIVTDRPDLFVKKN